jgi:TatD DNase family protein
MAPEPHRGKRCDSSMLTEVVRVAARELDISPQEAADLTAANAARLFGINL